MKLQNNAYGSIPAEGNSSEQDSLLRRHDDCNCNMNHKVESENLFGLIWTSLGMALALCAGISFVLSVSHGNLDSKSSSSSSSDTATLRAGSIIGSPTSMTTHDHANKAPSHLLDPSLDETALFYQDQYLDHIGVDTEHNATNLPTWSHRFYKKSLHFQGPGSPILVALGGEDALELPLLWPIVHEGLASELGAFYLSPEHRFYGESQPVAVPPTTPQLIQYLTPDQALADFVNLIQYVREELGCSIEPTSPEYCPVITFGGSYPGFLSTMMRFRFPDIIDIAYASSAPLDLYTQVVPWNTYYDKVSEVADQAVPGCAKAVRDTLYTIRDDLLHNYSDDNISAAAHDTGFCEDTFPTYMKDIPEFISETITYLVPAIFADFNMAYYPPSETSALSRACRIFTNDQVSPRERINKFFKLRAEVEYGEKNPKCFDLSLELPTGPHARIRGADNSGSGGGPVGEIWEFQCCKDLIIRAGYSTESMFLTRAFSYEWHKEHCVERFPGVPVEPFRMVNQWHFDDLSHVSRILFVNGLNDGWSTSSILETGNPELRVINLENGAHHSELGRIYPNPDDTPDVVEGHQQIFSTLKVWLKEIEENQV